MRVNGHRRVLFVAIAIWASGFTIAIVGVGVAVTDIGPWWAGVVIGGLSGFVGGIAGGHAAYRPSMHETVNGRVGVLAFLVVPIVALGSVLAYVLISPAPESDVAAAGFAAGVALALGGPATLLADVPLWKRRVRDASTCHAEWTARQPPAQRRSRTYAVVVLGVLTVGFVAITVALQDDFGGTTLVTILGGFSAALASTGNDRRVEVRDDGLLVDATLVPWGECDGYERTDDALVVHRSSRWFTRTHRFDVDDIEDPDAAADALRAFLPRIYDP